MPHETSRIPRLFSPAMAADPYPIYHQLRAFDPVHWYEPFGAWILTRYDDIFTALHDSRLSADRTTAMRARVGRPELDRFFDFVGKRMVFTDPPQHTRLRSLISQVFKPHIIEAMQPRIQALVDRFLERVQQQGHMDVIADLAFPLPASVIAQMLGVPPEDRDRLKAWSDDFIQLLSNDPSALPQELFDRAARAAEELTEYFRAVVVQRRLEPRDDLLTLLEKAEEQGDRLSEDELFATANLLMVAGHETTTNLIGNGLLALLRHPDQLEKLRADPALMHGAVDELLRYDSPVQFIYRIAKENLEIEGRQIRRGQTIHMVLGAANRDPAHFPEPDRLDITRAPSKHLALGQGFHYCLGAPLAKLEAGIAFRTLLQRLPKLRLRGDCVEHRENFAMRGLKELPVEF